MPATIETTDALARRLLACPDVCGLVSVRETDLAQLCRAVLASTACRRCNGRGHVWYAGPGIVDCSACHGSGRLP